MITPLIFEPEQTPLEFGETLIEANAGTGKTFTLCKIVERLVLDHGIPIERILAVTFTNSAAQELKERIRKNLIDAKGKLQPEQIRERNLLSRALGNFDDARIYTLHAFCKRLLSEFSFECGVRPDSELITDQSQILKQVVQDFRRSFFSDTAPFIAAMSMTGKLTENELEKYFEDKDLIRDPKKETKKTSLESEGKENLALFISLSKKWDQEKKCIQEFLHHGAKNGSKPRNALDQLDRLFRQELEPLRFQEDLQAESSQDNEVQVKIPNFQLIKLIRQVLKEEIKIKESSTIARPEFFDSALHFSNRCENLEREILLLFEEFAAIELTRLKSSLNLRTFDDLQQLVADGLDSDQGSALAEKVFLQYDAALVDEFQDTDPLQFEILRKLFSPNSQKLSKRIFYIGDPKQSIYKFRGADLNNYLDIKASLNSSSIHSLTTNYRTHPSLVEATNSFLTLCKNQEDGMSDCNHLFYDKRIFFIKSRGNELNAEDKKFECSSGDLSAAPFNLRYLPQIHQSENLEVVEERILKDMAGEILSLLDLEKKTTIGTKRIKGSDIAVLCRNNKEADLIQTKFSQHQIPSVLLATRSIFKTLEAKHFKYLMEALLNPFDVKNIKKVLVLPLFGLKANDIHELIKESKLWDAWANKFFEWSELWKKKGFSFALQNILKEELRLRKREGKAVTEKILSEIGGERRMTNYLHLGEILYQTEQDISSFPRNLYLWFVQQMESSLNQEESHARLESDEESVKILTIHKSKGLEFPITFLPFSWKTHTQDKEIGNQQENMRLLYVSLTRASSRLYLYLRNPNNQFSKNPISRCLSLDPIPHLEILKSNSNFFDLRQVLDQSLTNSYSKPPNHSPLKPVDFNGTIPSGRISSSFSNKVKGIEKEKDLDENLPQRKVVPLNARIGPHSFPAGTKAGNFFHEVFENIDFAQKGFKEVIRRLLPVHGLHQANIEIAEEIVYSTLQATLDKHQGESFQLSELSQNDRIEELEFHLLSSDFDLEELGHFLDQVEPGNPFATYLKGKKSLSSLVAELKFFKGFIDLTFKHNDKYFILDWKSNLLEGDQDAFAFENLFEEMKEADYLLQYHLYTLAIHRFLSQSSSLDYDYDLCFGGVYYLFIRGMCKGSKPDDGIFFDRPSKAIIQAMDRFLTI